MFLLFHYNMNYRFLTYRIDLTTSEWTYGQRRYLSFISALYMYNIYDSIQLVALTSKRSKLIHDWENNDFLQLSFFTLIFLKQYYS